MPMPIKKTLLFSGTGPANAAYDTGTIDATDYDVVVLEAVPSGPMTASVIDGFDVDLPGASIIHGVTPGDAGGLLCVWGGGAYPTTNAGMRYIMGCPSAPPPHIKFVVGALGAGVSAQVRVYGYRQFRGPDVSPVVNGVPTGD